MDPILVDVAQLRLLSLPAINLTPGRVLMARVVETGDGAHGQLAIAGGRIAALLPAGVRAGDELRLAVKEVSPERIVLQVQAQGVAAAPSETRQADPDREPAGARRGQPPAHVLALRYQTQHLGPIDLRFELHGEDALSVTVAMAGTDALARAAGSAEELRAALARAAAGQVSVSVVEQRPPLDVYV